MALNPTTITWQAPTQYVDGSAFGAADFAGYDFGFREVGAADFTPTVAVPVTFDVTSLDISVLDLPRNVDLELSMRTVATNGLASVWANPVDVRFDTRIPSPPLAFSVV